MRYPGARDRVRLVTGRLRDGLHVLRDGPSGLRASSRRRRDRRAGAARRAGVTAAGQQRRVHGHGRAARELRRTRGLRSTACTTTSGSRPAASRSAPSASCPASAASRTEACPVTLAVSLHAPDDEQRERARPAQPALPHRRGARRRRRVRGRRGPPGHVRVRLHRRRQRLAGAGRRARTAPRRLPRRRRRAREPDPAEPDRRLRRSRAPAPPSAPGLRRPAAEPTGSPPRCAATGAPTSPPRAGSSVPGRRCRPGRRRSGTMAPVNEQWKWVNQFQPQTLVMATILCYVDAVFGSSSVAASILLDVLDRRLASRPAGSASPTRRSGATRSRSVGAVLQVVLLLRGVRQRRCSTSTVIISLMFDARSSRSCSTR